MIISRVGRTILCQMKEETYSDYRQPLVSYPVEKKNIWGTVKEMSHTEYWLFFF